jgi:hypothetical protein
MALMKSKSNPAELDKSLYAGIIYAKSVDNSATVTKRTLFSWFGWGVPALAGITAVVLILFIQPGIIQKSNAPSDAVPLSQAVDMPPLQKQKAGNTVPVSITIAANHLLPGVFVDISDELTINLKNPVYDRSIYDNLGVKKEVAKLLL